MPNAYFTIEKPKNDAFNGYLPGSPERAAALGVEIHARAGAALAKQWPERGNGPREIADAVSGVLAGMNLPRPGQGVETLCPAYALRA